MKKYWNFCIYFLNEIKERNYVLPILNNMIKMFPQSVSQLSPKVDWEFPIYSGPLSFILHVLHYITITCTLLSVLAYYII